MNRKAQQSGISLIEIMIASLIGIFLLGGVMQIFAASKQSSRMQDSLSRLQENGRLALALLTEDIRTTGYLGCRSGATINNTLNSPTGFLYNFAQAIAGAQATSATVWNPVLDSSITQPLGGSDVITIRRAEIQNFTVTAQASPSSALTLDASATTANLQAAGFLDSGTSANKCAVAIVSDCASADVFQVTAITSADLAHAAGSGCGSGVAPGNASNALSKTYVGASVAMINTVSYYIRIGASGQPSLYRRRTNDTAVQELIEGVEQMQIVYGVDTDANGAPNTYLTADNVTNMAQVVSVRISLLLATVDDNITNQSLAIQFNGSTVNPGDRRLRRAVTTTIALRNRLG